MTALSALWLPILLSAVIVFAVSSLFHTMAPWHKGDYPRLPNQDKVRDALRPLALPPGDYLVPRPENPAEMRTPEFAQKLSEGPNVILTVMPNGPWPVGRQLASWFLYCVGVGFFAAYLASRALAPGAAYLSVFRFVGAAAFSAYVIALWQMSIWYGRSWSATIKATGDGLVYALLTAGTFGWLWP